MSKLVLLTGPQAVGKMTVGQELEKITNLKLFHNHMTIDLVSKYFGYNTDKGRKLVNDIRMMVFKEVSNSSLEGIIFTFVMAYDCKEDVELTKKIELARDLPGEILKIAKLPIEGLTVKNGLALVNGVPVSGLSEGEKLMLCIDITLAKENNLKLILLDGVEKLSEENREKVYKKCIDSGLQFIATRTDNSNELIIREF